MPGQSNPRRVLWCHVNADHDIDDPTSDALKVSNGPVVDIYEPFVRSPKLS